MKVSVIMYGSHFICFWGSTFTAAMLLLFWLFPFTGERAFEDAALGDQTQTVSGTLAGDRVHCFTMVDGAECLGPAEKRALERTVLWLGNSQLHAINQLRDGDTLASVQVARELRPHGTEVLTFSQPNANLQEHLVLFETLTTRLSLDLLILPVVFDDTRDGIIRSDIRRNLLEPKVAARLVRSDIGRTILEVVESAENDSPTLQDQSEAAITQAMDEVFGWEELRGRARGKISLTLYRTRNAVFGITPSSIRSIIPATYAANLAAFRQILASAAARGIAVLVYVPPIRSDVARPYDQNEYAAFRVEIEAAADRQGAIFADLEDIVPGPLWGTKTSTGWGDQPEYDFMHFQGPGHDLLAKDLLNVLAEHGHGL